METSRVQSNYNSTKLSRSPFKATQLWNEAVGILQNGMPTRRHFHRLRYYDSCFSGKEAVEWLTRTLTVNPRFGKNVTTDGTRKLLQHFLKAGVFHSVKGTLTFKESGLFEFVDRTICSPSRKQDNKKISSHTGLKEVDPNIPDGLRRHPTHEEKPRNISKITLLHPKEKTAKRLSYQEKEKSEKNIQWAEIILKRVQSLLPSLSVELLVDPASIHSDWVMYNVCPQYEAVRKRTELPFWVFTAITSVIRYSCLWYEDVQENARLVFQSILMLMSPMNRTTLRMLLQFIDQLPVPANSTITKTHMIYELSPHIISPGPRSKNVYSHHMVLSVVYFLVDNCHNIFKDLPYTALTTDKEENSKENKAIQGPKVFCRQMTKNQFEDQGVTSSWLALSELLDQIINNKKMKSKEKKKRLNKFKEAYPHIYKERFGSSSSDLASSVHFR